MRHISYFTTLMRRLGTAIGALAIFAGALFAGALLAGGTPAQGLEVTNMTGSLSEGPMDSLELDYELTCSDGAALLGAGFRWLGLMPEELKDTQWDLADLDGDVDGVTVKLDKTHLREMCSKAGFKSGDVMGRLVPIGFCGGEKLGVCPESGENTFLLHFTLSCEEDSEHLKAPTHTSDTGPPELQWEGEITQLAGDFGVGGSALLGFGECNQQAIQLSVSTLDTSHTFNGGALPGLSELSARGLGLFPANAAFFPGESTLDLDFTFVDVSYLYSLSPPSRRFVPEVSAGLGYAFVDAESSGGFEVPGADAFFQGFGEDSLTLNAGLRLRIHVGPRTYPGGPPSSKRYVFFGLRSRWFEARDRDEFETGVVAGFGFGVRHVPRPPRDRERPPKDKPVPEKPNPY